ncbi:MAG: DUF488 family protein [Anaerovoracaceae bacterium]|nr:DUF488 family protein [Bacillota bacterium]MDY2670532.1 DUF488 family protein [Anaerovoracaceae bacterium]
MADGNIKTKRVYEEAEEADGYRVLVDRLWPRGISKEKAELDSWVKTIAPSKELRQWFGHKEERYLDFRSRYIEELDANPDADEFADQIAEQIRTGDQVTLLYGAKSKTYNNAVVLREWLQSRLTGI